MGRFRLVQTGIQRVARRAGNAIRREQRNARGPLADRGQLGTSTLKSVR